MADSGKHQVIEIDSSSEEEESSLMLSQQKIKQDPNTIKLEAPINILETRRRTIDILLSKYSALHSLLLENEPFMNPEQRQKWSQNCPIKQLKSEVELPLERNDIVEYLPRNRTYPQRNYRKAYRKKKYTKKKAPRATGATTRRTTTTTATRTQVPRPTPSTSQPVRVKTERKPSKTGGGFKVKTERL